MKYRELKKHSDTKNPSSCLGVNKQSGFTLVEAVFYMGILAVLLVVLMLSLGGLLEAQRKIKTTFALEESSQVALERITREIRNAKSINTAASTLGTHPGVLNLETTDINGDSKTAEFYLDGAAVKMKENGITIGALTFDSVDVESLVFRQINTGISSAVRVEMTLAAGTSTIRKSRDFYSTIILRESY